MKITNPATSLFCAIFLVATNHLAFAAAPKKKADDSLLTLERIFAKNEFSAKGYSARWLDHGHSYTRLEKLTNGGMNIVRYQAGRDRPEILVPASDLVPPGGDTPLTIQGHSWSKDLSLLLIYTNSKRVWRTNSRGDYWLLDRGSGELRQLGGDAPPSSLMFAKISPDNRHIAYVRDRNIYLEDLHDHSTRQLTHAESPRIINGTFDWVYEEELGLRDGFRWSPDGESIAFWQLDTTGMRDFTLIDNISGLYPKTTTFAWPKVGQQNASARIVVANLKANTMRTMEIPGDPRHHYLARMDWADNSRELIVQQLNRLQNTNRVIKVNADSGRAKTILTEHDKAWVNIHDEMHWLEGGKQFTWISERDGWRHLYLVSRTGGKPKQITTGKFDVIDLIKVDEREKLFYFIASPDNPAERYLYRIRFDGKNLTRVTPANEKRGTHQYSISADGRWAFATSSNIDEPPQTRLITLPDHTTVKAAEDNKGLRSKIDKLKRANAEFLYLDTGKGAPTHARLLRPPDFNPKKKYPLLVYVYGEPAGQTVRDSWGGTSHLWHLMLAQKGYCVITIDNRGTAAPRGRDWRKSIYRKVGIIAPQDQAAALRKLLKDRTYIDSKRIGVWGWSGGGSMTLNAMFKFPDLYHVGMAVASVPNQRYYDTIYQERYMGLPGDNVDGYRKGSPINFAQQLKGDLLIVHGTGDDNCHYQTFEKLVDKLISHNKPFTMMAYPNRTHAIREGKNTTLHLYSLMTRFLTEHLPAGPR